MITVNNIDYTKLSKDDLYSILGMTLVLRSMSPFILFFNTTTTPITFIIKPTYRKYRKYIMYLSSNNDKLNEIIVYVINRYVCKVNKGKGERLITRVRGGVMLVELVRVGE